LNVDFYSTFNDISEDVIRGKNVVVIDVLRYGYRYLRSLGFQEDLEFCLQIDRFSILPVFAGGRITA